VKVNFKSLKSKSKEFFRKLVSLRVSPKQISTGFSIGVFIGIFPTFGFGGLLILAIAAKWKFNVPAALFGTILGNPILSPLWIGLTCMVTGISPSKVKIDHESFFQTFAHFSQLGLKYLLGNFVISLSFSLISYFIVFRIVHWIRKQKKSEE